MDYVYQKAISCGFFYGLYFRTAFTISVSPNKTGTENNCFNICLFISFSASLLDSFLNTMSVLMNEKGMSMT